MELVDDRPGFRGNALNMLNLLTQRTRIRGNTCSGDRSQWNKVNADILRQKSKHWRKPCRHIFSVFRIKIPVASIIRSWSECCLWRDSNIQFTTQDKSSFHFYIQLTTLSSRLRFQVPILACLRPSVCAQVSLVLPIFFYRHFSCSNPSSIRFIDFTPFAYLSRLGQ